MDQGEQSTRRAAASTTHDGLQVWAVDISTWPQGASGKEELTPLVEQLLRSKRGSDGDDAQRVMRFVREVDRTRALAALLLPRIALLEPALKAVVGSIEWDDLVFARTAEGRPYLRSAASNTHIDFNISHDGDWVVMALITSNATLTPATDQLTGQSNSAMRVGIDVMGLSLPNFEESAQSFLATLSESITGPEGEWIRSALPGPGRPQSESQREALERIYDLWTHKEALTKNLGLGLGFNFKRIQMGFWLCKGSGDGANREQRRSGKATILEMDGRLADQYSFVEISLPAGKGNASAEQRRVGAQCVVCRGPQRKVNGAEGDNEQIAPRVRSTEAVESGLLRVMTMEELVEKAKAMR